MFHITLILVLCQDEQYSENYTDISVTDHSDEKNNLVAIGFSIFLIIFISSFLLWTLYIFIREFIIYPLLENIEHYSSFNHKQDNFIPLEAFSEVIVSKDDFKIDLEDEQIFMISATDSKNNLIVIPQNERCSICLEPFLCENNEILKLNECTHIFHKDCISKWTANNKTCPICRNSIESK